MSSFSNETPPISFDGKTEEEWKDETVDSLLQLLDIWGEPRFSEETAKMATKKIFEALSFEMYFAKIDSSNLVSLDGTKPAFLTAEGVSGKFLSENTYFYTLESNWQISFGSWHGMGPPNLLTGATRRSASFGMAARGDDLVPFSKIEITHPINNAAWLTLVFERQVAG